MIVIMWILGIYSLVSGAVVFGAIYLAVDWALSSARYEAQKRREPQTEEDALRAQQALVEQFEQQIAGRKDAS